MRLCHSLKMYRLMSNYFILQTTFFASTEASLIGIAIPSKADPGLSTAGYIANIGLMCALVIHCHAGGFISTFR